MKKFAYLFALSGVLWAQSPGAVMTTVAITSDTQLPGGAAVGSVCSNYNVAYLNTTNGHQIACVNSSPLNVSNKGVWTVLSGGGGGGSVVWGGVGGTITNQTDLQTELASKQNLVTPLTCTTGFHFNAFASNGTFTCSADSGGGGGTTYTAGTGLSLTGTAFAVAFGTTAGTAAQGNDTRIVNALNSSSSLPAANLTGTIATARLPIAGAALGAVKSGACAGGSHADGTFNGDGTPHCSADSGGTATVANGATVANRPATSAGVSTLFLQLDRNPGDQLSYYNGTSWFYPGSYDSTMTRDATSGALGINVNAVPRLGAANTYTALNHFSSVQLDACTQADGTTPCFGAGSNVVAVQSASTGLGNASTVNFGSDFTVNLSGGVANVSLTTPGGGGGGVATSGASGASEFAVSSSANPALHIISSNASVSDLMMTNPNATSGGIHDWDMYATSGIVGLWDDTTGAGLWSVSTTNFSVPGGVQITSGQPAKPTCNSANKGMFWYTGHTTGVKDAVEVCAADAANAFAWRTIY
jgi:hypothetical protein